MAELMGKERSDAKQGPKPRLGDIVESEKELTKMLKAEITSSNDEDPHFWSAIYDWEKIKSLIMAGADMEAEGNPGMTALMVAAMEGKSDVCKFLIENGADVKARDLSDTTALMWAIQNGHAETCALLIEKGANVNAKNNMGWTPLMDAANANDAVTCNLLLEKGADISSKSTVGCTAISVAKNSDRMDAFYLLGEWGLRKSMGFDAAKVFVADFRDCVGSA
jgi:ankyrin repeat protein